VWRVTYPEMRMSGAARIAERRASRHVMKNILIRFAMVIVCAQLFAGRVAQAQPMNPLGGGFLDRLKAFFTELNLTEDQQNKIREIFMADIEKLMPLLQNQSLSREDKTRKFQEWGDQVDVKIQPILTPEQYQKYKEKKAEMQKAGQSRAQPLDRIKAALKTSDEESAVLKPLLEDVTKKQRERMSPVGVREIQELQKATADSGVPAADIQRLMEAVRFFQREKDVALKAARDRLREVLTARQEAVLLLYGILD
jgi:Spy/CpxP family protein refolding chaperone